METQDLIKKAIDAFSLTDCVLIKELGGKSGAHVLGCNVKGSDFSGDVVLKFTFYDDDISHGGHTNDEAAKHENLFRIAPLFAKKYVPRLKVSKVIDDLNISIYEIAGISLQSIRSLASIDGPEANQALMRVAEALIRIVDTGPQIANQVESAQTILTTWLDYRLDPKYGRIYDYFQDKLGIDPLIENLNWGSLILPNPYAFAERKELSKLPTQNIRTIIGYTHGDLHGDNILIDRFLSKPTDLRLRIIDFAEASTEYPMFFDHSYLELCEILGRCENIDVFRWLEFIAELSNISNLSDLHPGCIAGSNLMPAFEAVASIRQGLYHELKKLPSLPNPDMEGQILLSRIAVGLIFLHKKGITAGNRMKALAYASKSLADFIRLYSLNWPSESQVINIGGNPSINTIDYQDIWNACGMFDSQRYAYALVISETTPTDNWEVQQILRLPWAMVLDLNAETATHGFLKTASNQETTPRIIHIRNPKDHILTDFNRSICWILACGDSRIGGSDAISNREWQREFRRPVENHLEAFHRAMKPKPIRLVIIAGEQEDDKSKSLWESIDAIFKNALTTVILTKNDSFAENFLMEKCVTRLSLGVTELANAVHHILGQPSGPEDIRLPVRVPRTDGIIERQLCSFSAADLQSLEETLEIVHQGLAWHKEQQDSDLQLFYRGGMISWRDLEDHLDVDREITTKLKDEINSKILELHRVSRFQIEHAPGAGGTTVARHVAWNLKEKFPVVVVRKSEDKVELSRSLNQLYERTGLPVIAVVEMTRGRMTENDMDELVGELKGNHTRVAFITVKRVTSPRMRERVYPLARPMGNAEQKKFFERYNKLCNHEAVERLRKLSTDKQFLTYRIPFFYGLFVFEERFEGIHQYVAHHLADISEESYEAFRLITIVSAYSQSAVPLEIISGALGIQIDEPFDPAIIFGQEAQRLLLFEDDGLRVVHPLIAKKALEILLGDEWMYRLEDALVEIVDLLAEVCGSDSDVCRRLLADILTRRERWSDNYGQEQVRDFAELVRDIATDSGKAKVLENLTLRFPSEPHFWNHRGRFASKVEKNYLLAIDCLEKAKELTNNEDPFHWHSLGMVHRYEVRRRLYNRRETTGQSLEKAVEAFSHVQEVFDYASSCFKEVRNLHPEDVYGYITHLQLIVETIQSLEVLAGTSNAMPIIQHEILGNWCKSEIQQAEWLLGSTRILRAQEDEPFRRLEKLEGQVKALYGRFDDVIKYFESTLDKPIQQKAAIDIRRMLVCAYFARGERTWEKINYEDTLRIFELTSQNLRDGKVSSWDVRYWFNAYRRLSNFDLKDALSKLERLAAIDPSLEAYYYLYVVQFLEWFMCLTTDVSEIKETAAKCKELSGKFQKSFPFEWVANQPIGCPVANRSVLGEWRRDGDYDFFVDSTRLKRVQGVISNLDDAPTAGWITFVPPCATTSAGYQPMKAFFVPRGNFSPSSDLNISVEFFLGISYEGLRAYSVSRIED